MTRLLLEEVWRRGGEDDEEVLFGVILQVLADPGGNIYLLDAQLSHVEVFDPDGAHVGTLGREGDGPGEVRGPGDMYLTDDGRLGLGVAFPGRLVYVDSVGEPAGTVNISNGDPAAGGFTILRTYDVFDAEGHFAEQVRIACPGDGKEDALFFAGPDRMVQITGFMDAVRAMFGGVETDGDVEPEPMQVVCYQVNR